MKNYFYPILFLVFILSCANSIQIKNDQIPDIYQRKINAFGDKKSSRVILNNGEIIEGRKLKVMTDSLFILNKKTNISEIILLKEVHKIRFKDRIIGLGQGFYIGAGIGTMVGLAIGHGEEMGGLAVLGGIVSGGILGGISGYVIGGSHEFTFNKNK